MLARDGQERGIQWAPSTGKGSVDLLEKDYRKIQNEMSDEDDAEEGSSESKKKLTYSRWVISFEDETEARRFIRAWHMRPYPEDGMRLADGEPEPLIHAEFLW